VRPVFTLHAGEALTGEHISRAFRTLNIWVPAKDTGIDFLVTDSTNRRSVSLQVKFSRDFLVTHLRPEFQTPLRACGWWTFRRDKLVKSPADYWVLLLIGFAHRTNDYIIIPPKELARRLRQIHGNWPDSKPTCGSLRRIGVGKPEICGGTTSNVWRTAHTGTTPEISVGSSTTGHRSLGWRVDGRTVGDRVDL
jgi:hypothetical protein